MEPETEVRALDQNETQDPAVRGPTLQPLDQTGFGAFFFFSL